MSADWINGKDKFAAMMLCTWCQEITSDGRHCRLLLQDCVILIQEVYA
jgi:hypothetical protein